MLEISKGERIRQFLGTTNISLNQVNGDNFKLKEFTLSFFYKINENPFLELHETVCSEVFLRASAQWLVFLRSFQPLLHTKKKDDLMILILFCISLYT